MKCKHCDSRNGKINSNYKFYDIFECHDCQRWTRQMIDDCCRNPDEQYVFGLQNGIVFTVYVQCLNCFGCKNRTKGFSPKTHSEKVRKESIFLDTEYKNWVKAKQDESKEIYEIEKHLNYLKTKTYFYRNHLQSEYWKNIRRHALERDNRICQSCKKEQATEVHHLTYKNLGNESLDELISYCRACHEKVHEKTNLV
jgi:5-methylcytosine-specific restriction endonuclease McrA